MEQGLRSNEVFIKKKSSSGCLIIKKKIGLSSGGVGTYPRKGFGSNEEREKRNFGHNVSGSSEDSLEPNCREILPKDYRFYNGSAMYAEGILRNNRLAQNGEFEGERKRKFEGILGNDSFGRNGEFEGERKKKFEGILGNDSFGRNGDFEGERKRKFEGILRNDSFGRNGEFEGERKKKFEGILGNDSFGRNGEFDGERKRKFEGILGNDSFGRNGEFEGERKKRFDGILGNGSFGRNGEFEGERKKKFDGILGNDSFGRNGEFEGERKKKFEGILRNDSFGRNGEFEGERKKRFDGILGNGSFGRNGEFEGERKKKFDGILGNDRFGRNGEFEGERKRKFEGILGNDSFGRNGEFEGERKRKFEGILGNDSLGQNREFVGERKRKFEGSLGNNRFGRNVEFEGERRRKFDDVAFDENVGMYGKRMRKDDIEDRYAVRREFETESGRYGVNEYRNSPCFGTGLAIEARLPVSPLRQKFRVTFDKPIRVQGKNGVLKVMINKSKNAHVLRRFYEKYIEDVDRSGSITEIGVNTKSTVGASLYSGLKHREIADSSVRMRKTEPKLQKSSSKRVVDDLETNGIDLALRKTSTIMVNREQNMHTTHRSYESQQRDLVRRGSNLEMNLNINASVTPVLPSDSKISKKGNSLLKPEKSEIKLRSSLSTKAKNDGSETEGSDSSLKREPKGEIVDSSSKGVKSENKTPSAEKAIFVTCKETKVKRGTGTEKQLLREKIRHKLLTAGWTINYRPRKNRDYQDAVYINPAGTAYWSIIKAYEAFNKQMGEEDVPKELLNKLTRQTKKKMDKEMKMKQRENAIDYDPAKEEAEEDAEDNNDEKISFLKKKNSNSLKRKGEKPSTDTNSRMTQERKTQKIGRCTLLVRGSDKGSKSQNDDYVPYMGKRTLLSWLIDSGTVNESAEVEYMNRKINKALLKGWIGRNGIQCGCCNKILTVSKFEIHAGSKLQQPFQNIYLENGFSLLQCLIEAWNKQDKAKRCGFSNLNIVDDDENDDACGLCGDGGDLMCCDGCPSTFHQSCIGIQTLPLGDWHCPNCTCKFCERSSAQGNALLTCRLCERKYHKSCQEEIDALSADVDRDTDFCGKKCQEVFNKLHKLLEVKHELEAGFSWSLIHRTDIDIDIDMTQHGFPQKVECNSKLAVALSVIEECFLPINDRRSGINLIHNVLYNRGSNYSRLNHSGFYTAILERDDEIIAAASIRIHGTQLAEMPFIGTRHIYRRQGMCRRLLCAIESALSSLKVGKLIIPAIAEDMHTWIGVFSFNPLKKSHKKEMRSLNMVVFPRTEMLQKMLVEQNTIEIHITADSGAKSILSKEQLRFKPNVNRNSDCDPSFGHDFNGCDASLKSPPKADEKTAPIDSSLRVNVFNNDASSDGSSDIPSELNVKAMSKDKSNGVGFDAYSAPLDYSIDVHSSKDVHLENIKVVGPIDDLLGNNSTPIVK